nr:hypothetical protein [Neptuniibacter halophilus]
MTAVVLLVVILGISFYTSETVIMEKKVVGNEYRAKQAFHAAQAGVDYGIAYARIGLDQDDDGVLDLSGASGATESIGVGEFSVTLSDISSAADMSLIQVESIGESDDGNISRTISVLIGEVPLLPNPPDLPIVARGYVDATGNLNVYNLFTNLNIWSGDSISSWGSADTYIRDPSWNDSGGWTSGNLGDYIETTYYDNGLSFDIVNDIDSISSTTKNTTGPDVIDGDTNLSSSTPEEFIQNFFGKTLDELTEAATLKMTGNELKASTSAQISGNLIYLTDAKLNGDPSGGTIGTRENPVVLVTDGDLQITGGPTIYGVVVARRVDKVAGTMTVVGGIVSENELDMGTGTANVYYDESTIENTSKLKTMQVIRGSWKDW